MAKHHKKQGSDDQENDVHVIRPNAGETHDDETASQRHDESQSAPADSNVTSPIDGQQPAESTETANLDTKADGADSNAEVDKNNDTEQQMPSAPATVGAAPDAQPKRKRHFFGRIAHGFGRHKIWWSAAIFVVVVAVLALVPWTRFKIAGLFLKQTITVTVIDTQTHKPVTSAEIASAHVSAKTNNFGVASLRLPVGPTSLHIEKAYYKTAAANTTVPILKPKHGLDINLQAIGRQVPVTIINKITGKPIENASLSAAGSEVKTDAKGQATVVLPANKTSVSATLSASGYNNAPATVQVTAAAVLANTFQLVPAGKLYFLSNLSGTIDVVATNLDGSDRQTIVAGTGQEDPNNTALLATRDWRYLALYSKRDGGDYPKLFLIDTTTNKMTVMDEGSANFNLVGWDGHDFVYYVTRPSVQFWQPNRQALKSFNADTGALTTLDQVGGMGTDQYDELYQSFGQAYILDNLVVYSVNWNAGYSADEQLNSQQATIVSIKPDGSGKKTVQSFSLVAGTSAAYLGLNLQPYDADGLYIQFYNGQGEAYYEYEDDTVKPTTAVNDDTFYGTAYNTYLLSPSGNQTFWYEQRDGQNTLFVGDNSGDNGVQIASLSTYAPYGWYTDNYLLVTKNNSELYIMPAAGGQPLKVTDYYKPAINFDGYGSGYGGQ